MPMWDYSSLMSARKRVRSRLELMTKDILKAPDYDPAPYPDDVVNYRHYIIHEELPDNVRQGSQLLVFVRKVNSPSEFWINLCGPLYSTKLTALYREMRQFYELHHKEYALPPYAVVDGHFCVCIYRGEWHRARILSVTSNSVEVSLVDFGGTVFVNTENLRFMYKSFSGLPMQSFRAEIFGIRPRRSDSWPSNVCEYFRMQTSGRRFTAEVRDVLSQKHYLKVILLDDSGQSLSHLLLSSEMAEAETPTVKPVHDSSKFFNTHATQKNILTTVSSATLTKVSISKQGLKRDEGDKTPLFETNKRDAYMHITIEDVTISGNNLLLVSVGNNFNFIFSEFVHAFVGMHEHVVVMILNVLRNRVNLVKLKDSDLQFFFGQLKGRKVAGLNTESKRPPSTLRLLPLNEVEELISFLNLEGTEIDDLRIFLSSLL